MLCIGIEPEAIGWQAQTDPLIYGGLPFTTLLHSSIFPPRSRQSSFFAAKNLKVLVKDQANFPITGFSMMDSSQFSKTCSIFRTVLFTRKQCDQIWRNFATLAKNLKYWVILGGFIYCLANFGTTLASFGQMFVHVNGQMLKNNLATWSHCSEGKSLLQRIGEG